MIAEGVLSPTMTRIVLAWPGAGIAGFVPFAAIWAVVTGAAPLWASVALPLPAGRFLTGAAAILSLLLGILLIVHPVVSAPTHAIWLGAYVICQRSVLAELGIASAP
jgi:uncharacterized membrane protein HdeD (DUF308 family)